MYAGVDVGGSKVLVAVLDDDGTIKEQAKFPTPKNYDEFLEELSKVVAAFATKDFQAAGAGIPVVSLSRETGIAYSFGNLAWKNVPVARDLERIFGCPVAVENDAKLGGLSEALAVKSKYHKVLFLTLGTGIGIASITNGVIDTAVGDGGGRTLLVEHHGNFISWEDLASGRAIVERFGKKAAELDDEAAWQQIARELARGLIQLVAMLQPDVIIIGGSVGAHFDKYADQLSAQLKKYEMPLVTIPPLMQANHPEEAVIFGAYQLAKKSYGKVA